MDKVYEKESSKEVNKENKPAYANTFRTSYTETEFIIDFGFRSPGTEEVNLLSHTALPISLFPKLILSLFITAQQYEKEFNTDIGFGGNKEKDKAEE